MIDLIKKKVTCHKKTIKEKRELTLRSDHVYYLEAGFVMLEQNSPRQEKNYVLIGPNRFLHLPINEQPSTILVLEEAKIIEFEKNYLFGALEKDNILANFIWYLVKDTYKTLNDQLLQNNLGTKKKLLYILKEIAELYTEKKDQSSVVVLPKWLKRKHLSLLCHCSQRAMNYNLNKLEKEKILTFYASEKSVHLDKLAKAIKN